MKIRLLQTIGYIETELDYSRLKIAPVSEAWKPVIYRKNVNTGKLFVTASSVK